MSDLSTVTLAEILDELDSRCEAFIFAGMVKSDQRKESMDCAQCYYRGGIYTAMGLCEQMKHDLHTQLKQADQQEIE